MPEQYDNKNRGALFKNDKKTEEKHPDYRGEVNMSGTDCWLSAWIRKSKSGQTYMSLAVTPKDRQFNNGGTTTSPADPKLEKDIPF